MLTFNADYNAMIEKFLDFERMEKEIQLHNMPDNIRDEFYRRYVMHPKVSLMDMIGLPKPFNQWACFHLVGNQKNGIQPQSRTFYVEPTLDGYKANKGKGVQLEEPSRRNRRQYLLIDGPVALEAKKAIQALECFGPNAPDFNKGWLREITLNEYVSKSQKAQQEQIQAAFEADQERKRREVEKAKQVLAAAGQLPEEPASPPSVNLEDIPLEVAMKLIEQAGGKLTQASKKELEKKLADVSEQADPTTDPES